MSVFSSWEEMNSEERFNEMKKRKQERRNNKKSNDWAGSGDGTIVEDFDDSFDDDFEEATQLNVPPPPGDDDGADDGVLDPEFMKTAILEHARFLGMDPEEHEHLLWIAEEALTAQLPENWEQGVSDDGTPYHFNTKTNESMWEHPLDEHYRQLFQSELVKHKEQAKREDQEKKRSREREEARIQKEKKREREQSIAFAAAEKAAQREKERIAKLEEEKKRAEAEQERQRARAAASPRRSRDNVSEGLGTSLRGGFDGDILDSMTEKFMPKRGAQRTKRSSGLGAKITTSPKTSSWMDDIADAMEGDDSIDHDKSAELDDSDIPLFGSVKVQNQEGKKLAEKKKIEKGHGKTIGSTISKGAGSKSAASTNAASAGESETLRKEMERVCRERDEVRSERDSLVRERAELSSELKREKEDSSRFREKLEKAKKELHQAADEGSSHLKAEIEQLRRHLKTAREERKKLSTSSIQNEQFEHRANEAEKECEDLRKNLQEESAKARQAEREKKEAVGNMENQRARTETFKKEIDAQKETLQNNRTKIDALKHAKSALQAEIERVIEESSTSTSTNKQRTSKLERDLTQAKQDATAAAEKTNALSTENEKLMKEIETLKEEGEERERRNKQISIHVENEKVSVLRKEYGAKLDKAMQDKSTAARVAEAKQMKLRQQIEEAKLMSAKAAEVADNSKHAQKTRMLELEEECSATVRKNQELSERLAVVEALRAEDQAECSEQRRAALKAQEDAETYRRKLANSANEERTIKLQRSLEAMTDEKDKFKTLSNEVSLKLEKTKAQFKMMLETAMRRAANEASQDTTVEWQQKCDEQMASLRESCDQFKFDLKNANNDLKQKDREIIEFERKYARSAANLEVKEKEVMTLKSELEEAKRQLTTATAKIVSVASESRFRSMPNPPAAPESSANLNFSIPNHQSLGNSGVDQSLQIDMLQQHLSLLKTQAAAAASMVATVRKSNESDTIYRSVVIDQQENSLQTSNEHIIPNDVSSKTHRVLADLNVSYGKAAPGHQSFHRTSSRFVPSPSPQTSFSTTSRRSPALNRASWYKKGYWKNKYTK
jgi:chromosome segregation ATPase